jgi:Mn-dependent DtxR family transcriptional regulator
MRERKPYPNISDEELDRRAEEALKRMLDNPKTNPHQQPRQGGQGQNHQGHPNQNQPGRKRRPRRRPR